MPDNSKKIFYTKIALEDSIEIINYLKSRFSANEVTNYLKILKSFEKSIAKFPKLYPSNSTNNVRRAVLHKNLSVYYI